MTDDTATLILAELKALRGQVALVAADVALIRDAVQGHGDRLQRLERARLTPAPLALVHDSWTPDHGDHGR